MKWKRKLILVGIAFISFFSLLTFVAIFIADDPSSSSSSTGIELEESSLSVSQDTLNYRSLVEKYAKKNTLKTTLMCCWPSSK